MTISRKPYPSGIPNSFPMTGRLSRQQARRWLSAGCLETLAEGRAGPREEPASLNYGQPVSEVPWGIAVTVERFTRTAGRRSDERGDAAQGPLLGAA